MLHFWQVGTNCNSTFLKINRIYSFLKTLECQQPRSAIEIVFVCWLCKIQNILS